MDTLALSVDSAAPSRTELITQEDVETTVSQPVLKLRLKKPKSSKKVGWREGTIDNEHMGKKKSKCCCIYKKPTVFGESSSEDDGECENCFGHPEKKRKNRKNEENDHEHHNDDDNNEHCPNDKYRDEAQSNN